MDDASPSMTMTRRRLLTGGLVGAGTLALASCIADPDPPDAIPADEVWAARVSKVPATDPGSDTWRRTTPTTVTMAEQAMALPFRPSPSVPSIDVRAVHDGSTIAFRLDWNDADVSDLTVSVDSFRDACAVLLGPGAGDDALRTMGTPESPVVLLHWKADWQLDMEQGRQGQAQVYPNRSVDVYPPLQLAVPRDVTAADYRKAGATEWLPGLHVGNPLSSDERTTCVEKLVAGGFGTATTATAQDAAGFGQRGDGSWKVVVTKPLAATEDGEPALSPGGTYTCAFAIWSGSTRDAGGRKSPSATTFKLALEA